MKVVYRIWLFLKSPSLQGQKIIPILYAFFKFPREDNRAACIQILAFFYWEFPFPSDIPPIISGIFWLTGSFFEKIDNLPKTLPGNFSTVPLGWMESAPVLAAVFKDLAALRQFAYSSQYSEISLGPWK